jgi:hypothetical protein
MRGGTKKLEVIHGGYGGDEEGGEATCGRGSGLDGAVLLRPEVASSPTRREHMR